MRFAINLEHLGRRLRSRRREKHAASDHTRRAKPRAKRQPGGSAEKGNGTGSRESADKPSLQRIAEAATAFRTLLGETILIAVMVIVILLFLIGWRNNLHTDKSITISEFDVPKELSDKGYTARRLAQMLQERIIYINRVAVSPGNGSSVPFQAHAPPKVPSVDVAGTKLDMDQILHSIEDNFNPSPHVDGSVTMAGNKVTMTLHYNAEDRTGVASSGAGVEKPLNRQDHTYTVTGPVAGDSASRIDDMMAIAALKFVGYYSPCVAALYEFRTGTGAAVPPHTAATHLARAEDEVDLCLSDPDSPDKARAYDLRGLIRLEQRRYPEALQDLQSSVVASKAENKQFSYPYYYMAIADTFLGRYAEADRQFQEVDRIEHLSSAPSGFVKVLPTHFARLPLGFAHSPEGQLLPIHPDRDEALMRWALALEEESMHEVGPARQRDGTDADNKFQLAILCNPSNALALTYFADWLLRSPSPRPAEAVAKYRQALALLSPPAPNRDPLALWPHQSADKQSLSKLHAGLADAYLRIGGVKAYKLAFQENRLALDLDKSDPHNNAVRKYLINNKTTLIPPDANEAPTAEDDTFSKGRKSHG